MLKQDLKKILIIAYFFPPCTLTAASRAYSWAKDLHQFGYYPIIITRNWSNKIEVQADISKAAGSDLLMGKKEGYEVHYLPYKPNLRDRLLNKFGANKFSILRKALTVLELIAKHVWPSFIPYHHFLSYAKEVKAKNPDINHMVCSANPFEQFHFCYLLKKAFPDLNWIADYRDAWTTSEINAMGKGFLFRKLERWDRKFEKKWVRTASLVTSVSEPIAANISKLTGTKASVIHNGFQEDLFDDFESNGKCELFTVSYIGTLYPGQDIELFLGAFQEFIKNGEKKDCRICFPGLAYDNTQAERVKQATKKITDYVEISHRIPREQILELERKSHLLLHIAWKGFSGIIASKIYEYVASGTPILIAPGDNGSIDDIVTRSKCGRIANTKAEIIETLEKSYKHYKNGETQKFDVKSDEVLQFSRLEQTKKLAALLDEISAN